MATLQAFMNRGATHHVKDMVILVLNMCNNLWLCILYDQMCLSKLDNKWFIKE